MEDKLGKIAIPAHLLVIAQPKPVEPHVDTFHADDNYGHNALMSDYVSGDHKEGFTLGAVLTLATGRNMMMNLKPNESWMDEAERLATFLSSKYVKDYRDVIGHPLYRDMILAQLPHLTKIVETLDEDGFRADWEEFMDKLEFKYGRHHYLQPMKYFHGLANF
jgi:hypothetical protein